MGNGASLSVQKHVVVVGGGYGGSVAAMALKKANIPFMLIDSRDCMHHNVAGLRAAVEPGEIFFLNIIGKNVIMIYDLYPVKKDKNQGV